MDSGIDITKIFSLEKILILGKIEGKSTSGLPFASPGDLPNPGIEPGSLALQADALPSKDWKERVIVLD